MNASQWAVLGVIGTLIVGAITLYYLAKSNARENLRQQRDAVDKAVDDATAPLKQQNAALASQLAAQISTDNLIIARRDRTIELREKRIDELEDQLRGNR